MSDAHLNPAQLRAETARRLWRVIHNNDKAGLDSVLTPALPDSEQHAWMSAALYGCVRFYLRYQYQLNHYLSKPIKAKEGEVIALFILGMHQLSQMRVKEHAAIHETVNACKILQKDWAIKLLNGVLRNYQRDLTDKKFNNEVERYAHPKWLMNRLKQDWPKNWRDILEANNAQAAMSLRVNLSKTSRTQALASLTSAGLTAQAHSACPTAVTLDAASDVSKIPNFSRGYFSVQDVAAQHAAHLLIKGSESETDLKVLDACAAPGGKTGHLLERLSPDSNLLALDISEKRLEQVNETIMRLGYGDRRGLKLLAGDAAEYKFTQSYDRILLDAPCTATGVIRRHPDIKLRRSAEQVLHACDVQKKLLHNLWRVLNPGGRLLYATCSVLHAENCDQVQEFLSTYKDATLIPVNIDDSIDTEFGAQILPGSLGRDGFFYALLEKTKQD